MHPLPRPNWGAFMSRLQALATALNDLADKANDSELGRALELCISFANRIPVERPDSHDIDEVTQTTLPRRPNLPKLGVRLDLKCVSARLS